MDLAAKFFRACRTGNTTAIAQLLLQHPDLSVSATDENHFTGLIWAARKGQVQAVAALLTHGAPIEQTDRRRRAALFHAASFGHCGVVEGLVAAGADVSPIDCYGCTSLDVATMEYPRPGPVVATLRRLGGMHARYPRA